MAKISDKFMHLMATTAEEAFWEALGLASKSGAYEPKQSDFVKTMKKSHISKFETLFDKFCN